MQCIAMEVFFGGGSGQILKRYRIALNCIMLVLHRSRRGEGRC